MELGTLADRLDYERGGEREAERVMLLSPGGRRYDVMSLNWDDRHGCWVLVGDWPE